jgi:hypothetical protein
MARTRVCAQALGRNLLGEGESGSESRDWLGERRNGEEGKDEAGEISSINEEVAGETGPRTV